MKLGIFLGDGIALFLRRHFSVVFPARGAIALCLSREPHSLHYPQQSYRYSSYDWDGDSSCSYERSSSKVVNGIKKWHTNLSYYPILNFDEMFSTKVSFSYATVSIE